jgi:hypothetical protein
MDKVEFRIVNLQNQLFNEKMENENILEQNETRQKETPGLYS